MKPRREAWLGLLLALCACTESGEVLQAGNAAGNAAAGNASAGVGNTPVILHASEVRLSTGQSHACSVTQGILSCWGENADAQLGVAPGAAGEELGPVTLEGGNWLVPAAGERHTCALSADGRVWCWGANNYGQLGTGDRTESAQPREVPLPESVIELRTSFHHTCVVLRDASLWCWGYNLEGQLGLGDRYPGDDQLSPVQVGVARDWVFVAPGQGHSCGIRSPGELYCWGRNTDFQLGQGSADPEQIRSPTRVGADSDWVEVGVGQASSCARKRDKTLYCWGSTSSGVLAVGDVLDRSTPARVPNSNDWSSVASATFHTCGLRGTGEIWCAGRNSEGQLGEREQVDALPDMLAADPGQNWVEVRVGRFFTCARKADNSVWCLGSNRQRELGQDAALDHSTVMVRVP